MLKIWNVVLIILTFGLTIVGTFLTRSGIINSVHAFTQSEIGPAFLIFLAFILVIGFSLLFKRIQMLESEHKIESVLCRENTFLAQNVLLVGIAFTVLLGTTFPLLAEAVRGTKLSIQAQFFNTIIAPMGYLVLFLMGIGTLIAWLMMNRTMPHLDNKMLPTMLMERSSVKSQQSMLKVKQNRYSELRLNNLMHLS